MPATSSSRSNGANSRPTSSPCRRSVRGSRRFACGTTRERTASSTRRGSPTRSTCCKVDAVRRLDRAEFGEFKIEKKLLKGAVKNAMLPTFGTPQIVGPLWQYTTTIEALTISTRLDFGGRPPSQLRYHQWIHCIKDGKRVWLLDHGGIGSLLGSPKTEWRYLTDADIPEAANLLVQVCKEFIDAVPGMWARSGLTGAEGEPS